MISQLFLSNNYFSYFLTRSLNISCFPHVLPHVFPSKTPNAATTAPPLCGYQVLWDAAKMGDAQAIRQVTARPAALAVIGVGRFYSAKNG
jgi:hypothetical protein